MTADKSIAQYPVLENIAQYPIPQCQYRSNPTEWSVHVIDGIHYSLPIVPLTSVNTRSGEATRSATASARQAIINNNTKTISNAP